MFSKDVTPPRYSVLEENGEDGAGKNEGGTITRANAKSQTRRTFLLSLILLLLATCHITLLFTQGHTTSTIESKGTSRYSKCATMAVVLQSLQAENGT